MPTLIIVDNTSELFAALDPVDANQRAASVAKGIEDVLLGNLEHKANQSYCRHHPRDLVALFTASPSLTPLVPFTREYEAIVEAIKKLEPEPRPATASQVGVCAIRHLQSEIGEEVACHVIWATARHTFLRDGFTPIPQPSQLPAFSSGTQLHCVLYHGQAQSYSSIQLPVHNPGGGSIHRIFGEDAQARAKAAYEDLLKKCYNPFSMVLACGQITSPVTIYPPPTPVVYSDVDGALHVLPQVVSVQGFLNTKDVSSFPVHSRHQVLSSAPAEDSQRSGCRLLLHEALRVGKVAALCLLRPNWHALIYTLADHTNKKRFTLVLSILMPQLQVPWLGSLSDLSFKGLGTHHAYVEVPLKEKPTRQPSYANNKNIQLYNDDVLESNFSKVSKYASKLAQKPKETKQLVNTINKLRTLGVTYSCNTLITHTVSLLEAQISAMEEGSEGRAVLQQLINQLNSGTDVSAPQ